MTRKLYIFLAVACSLPGLMQTSSMSWAQVDPAEENVHVCVTRPRAGLDKNAALVLKVSKADLQKLSGRGFTERECAGVRISGAKATKHMCEIAAFKDSQLEADFEARHGVTPSEICKMGAL